MGDVTFELKVRTLKYKIELQTRYFMIVSVSVLKGVIMHWCCRKMLLNRIELSIILAIELLTPVSKQRPTLELLITGIFQNLPNNASSIRALFYYTSFRLIFL